MKLSFSAGRVLVAAVVATSAVLVPGSLVSPVTVVSALPCTLCAGGEYHAVTPVRVFDSRPDSGGPGSAINDGVGGKLDITFDPNTSSVVIDLVGAATGGSFLHPWLPVDATAADVLAVAATVTVVNPSVSGYLSTGPGDAADNSLTSSLVNFSALQNTPNMGVLRPDSTGHLKLALSSNPKATGKAHVLIDVLGWFSTSGYATRGSRLVPTDPGRILDTRGTTPGTPIDQNGGKPSTPLPAGDVDVAVIGAPLAAGGTGPVPNDSTINAVMVNITAVRPTGSAPVYLATSPDPTNGTDPGTSALNLNPGQTRAATVIVPLGSDGHFHLYNGGGGNTPVLVDVVGYLRPDLTDSRDGRVVPLSAPFRAFDTRDVAFGKVPLGPAQAEDWSFAAFAASVNIGGTAVGNQLGFIGNLTNAKLARQYPTQGVQSFLTVYPTPASAGSPPVASNLNSGEGAAVANTALVKYGANQTVRVFNATGYADYLLDVSAVVLSS